MIVRWAIVKIIENVCDDNNERNARERRKKVFDWKIARKVSQRAMRGWMATMIQDGSKHFPLSRLPPRKRESHRDGDNNKTICINWAELCFARWCHRFVFSLTSSPNLRTWRRLVRCLLLWPSAETSTTLPSCLNYRSNETRESLLGRIECLLIMNHEWLNFRCCWMVQRPPTHQRRYQKKTFFAFIKLIFAFFQMHATVEPFLDPERRPHHKHRRQRQDQTSHSLLISARLNTPLGIVSTERRASPWKSAKKFSTIASKLKTVARH